jgi:hypothetical protein
MLNFGGAQTFTGSASTVTIDVYGRVIGFTAPDNFYYTSDQFTATSGQTVFTPTARVSGYITGQDLIFRNGILLTTSDYSETSSTFTLSVGAVAGDVISCLSMRALVNSTSYVLLSLIVTSTSTNTAIWNASQMPYQLIMVGDVLTFSNVGTPTTYTVTGVNYTTRTITFSTTITGVSAGASIYQYRASGTSYPAFSRWEFDLVSIGTYTPTTWAVNSGYELLFLNGTQVNEQDYDIVGGAITNFPAVATGKMVMIQFNQSNLGTPIGNPSNVIAFTVNGQASYSFTYDPLSFDLYANGCILEQSVDYTTAVGSYVLTSIPTNNATVMVQQTFTRVGAA